MHDPYVESSATGMSDPHVESSLSNALILRNGSFRACRASSGTKKKINRREKLTNLPKNVTFLVRKELEDKEDRGNSKWQTIFIRISIRMVFK